jgi:general stress protein 26
MAEDKHLSRVWDIIEGVGACMLTTRLAASLRARPVEARPDRAAGAKAYLSITARAEIQRDRARAAAVWNIGDNLWWSGPDDPNVCLLRVTPLTAELWDGPASKAVAVFEFVKSRLSGEPPNLGENRKVTVAV